MGWGGEVDVENDESPTETVGHLGPDVERAIRATLPTGPGMRNRRIFDLARTLKSMPELADADPCGLIHIVREWHLRALPMISTKDVTETVYDFNVAWGNVRSTVGAEPLPVIFARAVGAEPPAKVVRTFPGHREIQLLAAFCRELQRSVGRRPFFLSGYVAAKLLEAEPMSAYRWLSLLVQLKMLRVVRKGDRGANAKQATMYRWIGGNE